MSKNIKEWLIALIILISLLGFFLLYIYKAREVQSEIKLSHNLKTKFIKNFITPIGIDFNLLLVCKSNDKFDGDIILKEKNQIIYQKKINNLLVESYISSNLNQQKYYILVPKGILKQHTKYTLIGNFQKVPIVSSLYLRFFKSNLGSFFHRFGLDWFRIQL